MNIEEKIYYGKRIKIAIRNCKGLNEKTKREQIAYIMWKREIDVFIVQETHINTNSTEIHDGCIFIFSTSISDKDREERGKRIEACKLKRKGERKMQKEGI